MKYTTKFTNKKPLRGVTKRPIAPSTTEQTIEVAARQLTKVGKSSADAAIKDTNGDFVPFSSIMGEVLSAIFKKIDDDAKEESPSEPEKPPVDPEAGETDPIV